LSYCSLKTIVYLENKPLLSLMCQDSDTVDFEINTLVKFFSSLSGECTHLHYWNENWISI